VSVVRAPVQDPRPVVESQRAVDGAVGHLAQDLLEFRDEDLEEDVIGNTAVPEVFPEERLLQFLPEAFLFRLFSLLFLFRIGCIVVLYMPRLLIL
jgi:hypothetical protein